VDNLQHCPNCGWPLEPDDKFCRNCGKPFEERREETPTPVTPLAPPTPPASPVPPSSAEMMPPPEPVEEKYVPWEDRQRLGFFAALWKTWAESVFNPDRYFSKLPFKGGLGSPILYALIITWFGSIVENIYRALFSNLWLGILRDYIDQNNPIFNMDIVKDITIFSFFQSIFIAPILILLGLFIFSGIYHLICIIFGWAKRDFEATLRAVSYSVGPAIFVIIPMCGSPIGWIWSLVLLIIGLKHMQQTTGGKAAFVALLPLILCCCMVFMLALIFGTAILALVKGASQSGYGF
jgi:hypothetical protein